jgi:uncharacterized protein (DUF433 family)
MSTAMESRIQRTEGVLGGDARIAHTRIPVWLLVLARKQGSADEELLADYRGLTGPDLDAAWQYYGQNPIEIEQAIWFNDIAANVPEGTRPPDSVIVAGRLLGLTEDQIRSAFDPPLSVGDLAAAWDAFRADPVRIGEDIARHRIAG